MELTQEEKKIIMRFRKLKTYTQKTFYIMLDTCEKLDLKYDKNGNPIKRDITDLQIIKV